MVRIKDGRRKPSHAPSKVKKRDAPATPEQRDQLKRVLARVPGMMDIPEYVEALTYSEAQWVIVELAFPQFRMVDDEWAVIGTVDSVKPGSLEVHKKDGTSTHVQVKKVSKPFEYMGRDMVHGHIR